MAPAIVPDLTDSPTCLCGTPGINFVKAATSNLMSPTCTDDLCVFLRRNCRKKKRNIDGDKIKNPDGAFAIKLYSNSDTRKECRVSGGLWRMLTCLPGVYSSRTL